jgi:cysteine-rich repeat protein
MCKVAVCGDAVVHVGIEACDDGNPDDADACTSECALAGCGDGIVMMGVEECDDGNAENTDACTASCKNAICGDGILWIGTEECEDGNVVPGDGCEPDCKKTLVNKYTAFGPQVNVPAASVVGWEVCYSDTYGISGMAMATILGQCGKANLMLACRPVGSATYSLLAHGPRTSVITDTGQSNTPTNANGSGWYYSDAYSWGFAGQGDVITRSSCDTAAVNPEQRLCWHTGGGAINGGWRCGATTGLNGDNGWERVVLHAD